MTKKCGNWRLLTQDKTEEEESWGVLFSSEVRELLWMSSVKLQVCQKR